MSATAETKLDFDRTVNTEDRFAIRKTLASFIRAVNNGQPESYGPILSDAVIVEGFSDIVQVKQGFLTMLQHRFNGQGRRLMQMPQLKLSYSHYLFHLKGTYEEIDDGLLATEGTIEISVIKEDQNYKIVRIVFYPRMMLTEDV
jgi:hypothetical protein